jgi:cell division initiation protein
MDSPKANEQSSLDSLRTVEFRQTLRGYHIDDVDEYLERVAVEAEALQEQLRQSDERTNEAAERIAQLEHLLAEQREEAASAEHGSRQDVTDETLQRTLLLAQKFVDQTKGEAEAEARATVSKAEEQARKLLADAETQAHSVTEDAESRLREEIERLENRRTQLAQDTEKLAQHIDGERNRLRSALVEMLTSVDDQVQPAVSALAQHEERSDDEARVSRPSSSDGGENSQASAHDMQRKPSTQSAGGAR